MVAESPGQLVELLDRAFNRGDIVALLNSPRTFTATTVLRKQPDGGWKALIDNAFGPQVLGPE